MKFTGKINTTCMMSYPLAIHKKKGKLRVTTHFIAKFELHRAFFQSQG